MKRTIIVISEDCGDEGWNAFTQVMEFLVNTWCKGQGDYFYNEYGAVWIFRVADGSEGKIINEIEGCRIHHNVQPVQVIHGFPETM